MKKPNPYLIKPILIGFLELAAKYLFHDMYVPLPSHSYVWLHSKKWKFQYVDIYVYNMVFGSKKLKTDGMCISRHMAKSNVVYLWKNMLYNY
jgi:hypothetical protein